MTPAEATPLLIDALHACYWALYDEATVVDSVGTEHADGTPEALRTAFDLLMRLGATL